MNTKVEIYEFGIGEFAVTIFITHCDHLVGLTLAEPEFVLQYLMSFIIGHVAVPITVVFHKFLEDLFLAEGKSVTWM